MAFGPSERAVSMTCLRSGLPASGCSTFGSEDFMRLPSPAARITTESGGAAAPDDFGAGLADLVRVRWGPWRILEFYPQRLAVTEPWPAGGGGDSITCSFSRIAGPTYSCGLECTSCPA